MQSVQVPSKFKHSPHRRLEMRPNHSFNRPRYGKRCKPVSSNVERPLREYPTGRFWPMTVMLAQAEQGPCRHQQLGLGASSQYSQPALFLVLPPPLLLPQAPKQAALASKAAHFAWQLSLRCAAMPRLGAGSGLGLSAASGGIVEVPVSPSDSAFVVPAEVGFGTTSRLFARLGRGTTTFFAPCEVESGRSPKWTWPLLSFQRYTSA